MRCNILESKILYTNEWNIIIFSVEKEMNKKNILERKGRGFLSENEKYFCVIF